MSQVAWQTEMDTGGGDDHHTADFGPPIEVVHAFGSCPDKVRDNICALDDERVAYVVGSRIAVTTANNGETTTGAAAAAGRSNSLEFLSTGLRVARVTCVVCSADRRFVAVCYKALGDDGPSQAAAYATVYHMPTRPRPSRAKTLSYERPRRKQRQQERRKSSSSESRGSGSTSRCDSDATGSSTTSGGERRSCTKRLTPPPPKALASATAEFVTATFSHDGRILAMLDGSPEWTLLWFEWKTGKRMFTLQLDSSVYRYWRQSTSHNCALCFAEHRCCADISSRIDFQGVLFFSIMTN